MGVIQAMIGYVTRRIERRAQQADISRGLEVQSKLRHELVDEIAEEAGHLQSPAPSIWRGFENLQRAANRNRAEAKQ